jgi:sugar lactone lactonase YvrE
MRKKVVASCMAVLCFASITSAAMADTVKSDMKVVQDGKASQITESSFLVDSTLYAAYASVGKELGVEVKWDSAAKMLTLSKENQTIQLTENSGTPLQSIGGEVYVPVRFVYETFGYRVGYDDSTRTVTMTPKAKVSILADIDPAKPTGHTEGLIADKLGRLYTVDQETKKLYRVLPDTGKVEELTVLPKVSTGMVFDQDGNLYLAAGGGQGVEGVVLRVPAKALAGGAFDPTLVETFVTGTNGANGLVFDAKGNLYVSGTATGNIYVVSPAGKVTTWATGMKPERSVQPITANGVIFDQQNRLYIANTSSGEISRVQVNEDGSFGKLELFAKDALLYGADGITWGPEGDLYLCANERNAIVKVTSEGKAIEVTANDNEGPLEFPASLRFVGSTLYVSDFDQPRGVNKDNKPGIGASIAKIELGSK